MTLTELLMPTYIQMLRALSAWLDKAEGSGSDDSALLESRLAPDMYPLAAQIRFVCVQAQEAAYRLSGQAAPHGLTALRNGKIPLVSFDQARAIIAETMAQLEAPDGDAFDAGADRPVSLEMPNGIAFDLTGAQYARDWSLPQFYFHLMTAYAILRHKGVDLGKPDYVPHMMAYIRAGTMPGR